MGLALRPPRGSEPEIHWILRFEAKRRQKKNRVHLRPIPML